MKKILEAIGYEVEKALEAGGYDTKYAKVTYSDRPDLCEYQCNGAMAAAKEYRMAPIQIATKVVEQLEKNEMFSSIEAVNPGFINMKISDAFLSDYLNQMAKQEQFGYEKVELPKTILIEYGVTHVSQTLQVDHRRFALHVESINRLNRFVGHHVIGDIPLGHWGLQVGPIVSTRF